MKSYVKSLPEYEQLLQTTRKDIETSKLELQDFLSSNTGKRTSRDVNQLIMSHLNNMVVLGYNERFYEGIVNDLTKGYAISKV
jgi:uncharacterized membrane protein